MKSKMNRALAMLFALVMVVTVFPVVTSTAAEPVAPTADDLYVKAGLEIWLDGEAASTVDLAGGTWTSKWPVDGEKVTATLGGSWKAGRNEGSYRFDLAAAHLGNQLTLPISALPTGDYTIDMLTMTRGYTVNGDGVTSALIPLYTAEQAAVDGANATDPNTVGTDGLLKKDYAPDRYATQPSSFVIGPLMADTFGQERTVGSYNYERDCAWNDAAWYYSSGVDLYVPGQSANANWVPYAGKFGWGQRNYAFTYEGDFPSNVTIQLDVEGTTQANYSFYKNGTHLRTFNGTMTFGNSSQPYPEVVPVDTATMKWEMFRGFPVELYQFRVYNRVLNQDEKNRNHLADLAKYFDLDLSCLAGADDEKIAEAADAVANIGFGGTKADVQLALDRAADLASVVEGSRTAYDELYAAKEDMIVLLSAFDAANDKSIDLLGGRWYNKVNGGEDFGTLHDAASVASWEIAKNGKGIGYAFANLDDYAGNLTSIGLLLPTDSFTDTDMAVEYVFAANPVRDGEGNQVKIGYTATPRVDEEGNPVLGDNDKQIIDETFSHGGKYGVFNAHGHSNFSFAGLHVCHFILTENPLGASMQDRVFYAPAAWEDDWGNRCNCGSPVAEHEGREYQSPYLFGTAEGWNEDVITLSFDRTVTAGGDYNQASFDVLLNGDSKLTVTNLEGNHECANQDKFYTIDELNEWNGKASTAGDAFFGVPSTVYAIRVYDRVLTAEEKAQNHAVDLMAYFGLDVSNLSAASDATKAGIFQAFSKFTFEASDAQVAAMQYALNAIPTAEGTQISKDGTALRVWASTKTFETVADLGMKIIFKQDGVKVGGGENTTSTAFSAITAGETVITAEAEGVAGFYAASVSGIPAGTYTVEVTPYVILKDGNVLYGITQSKEITFN